SALDDRDVMCRRLIPTAAGVRGAGQGRRPAGLDRDRDDEPPREEPAGEALNVVEERERREDRRGPQELARGRPPVFLSEVPDRDRSEPRDPCREDAHSPTSP